MQGAMADQALTDFEVELGLKSPETTPVVQTAKDLGPATTEKATEKQTTEQALGLDQELGIRSDFHGERTAQTHFLRRGLIVVLGLVGLALWRYGAIGPGVERWASSPQTS